MSPMDGSTDLVAMANEMGLVKRVDPVEAQLAIGERIMSAETLEELLEPSGTDNAETFLNIPLVFLDAEFRESDFPGGPPIYALARCAEEETGEERIINCGGFNVVYQLIKAVKSEWLPFTAMITKTERPTSNGYHPYWLVKPTG